MKSIPNKSFVVPGLDKPESTVSLLKMCLQFQPQGGFDFKTMRDRLKIEGVLEKVTEGGMIDLEDADHAAAVEAIKQTRWLSYGPHLIQFAELFGL